MVDSEQQLPNNPSAPPNVSAEPPITEKTAANIPAKKSNPKAKKQNIIYKISALLLAILLWVYVTASQNPLTEATYTIPIEQRNLSSELALLEQNHQVQVRVQGNAATIDTLSTRNFEAYIDLTGVMAGEATLEVKVEMPDTIQLVSLSPESISVTLEKVVEKVFPVEIKTLGTPREAYTMMDTVITPSQITLSGPADYIQQVATVFVNADVSGLSASYNQNLTVEVLDAAGGNISAWFTITPATCNVVIPIVYSQPDKNVAISPRLLGKPALGYQVSRVVVEPATVKVLGSLEHLNQLYYIETVAININDLKESISRTVSLNPPNNISLTTETVTVAIQIEPVATATFAKDLIYIEHLSTEFSATLGESTVNITVAGPNTDIQKLTTADVIPYVDCHSITAPGEYTLPVKTTLPANINMVGANPAEVNVTIINTTTPPQNDETKNEVI